MAEWIICCGMIRSGSTLQYQLVKELLETRDLGMALGYYEGDDLVESIEARKNYKGLFIIKCHDYLPYIKNLDKGENKFIYSYRDPRDVIVSTMNKENRNFESVFDSKFRFKFQYNTNGWMNLKNLYTSRYEDLLYNLDQEISRVASFLNLTITRQEIIEISERYSLEQQKRRVIEERKSNEVIKIENNKYSAESLLHHNHIYSGQIDQWRATLNNYQISLVQYHFREWFLGKNYELKNTFFSNIILFRFYNFLQEAKSKGLCKALRLKTGKLLNKKNTKLLREWEHFLKSSDDTIIKTIDKDLSIILNKDSGLSKEIYLEVFEPNEIQFLHEIIRKGMVVLDIGANIGLFSLLLSRLVGEEGKVYSFEPIKETYNRLVENIKFNKLKNVTGYNLALADKAGKEEMLVSLEGYDAWNSFVKPSEGRHFDREIVESIILDDFVYGNNIKPDFIKIDTEGWEYFVLKGGKNYLANNHPILMIEFTKQNLKNANIKVEVLASLLFELGYSLFKINSELKLEREDFREDYSYTNLIAMKAVSYESFHNYNK